MWPSLLVMYFKELRKRAKTSDSRNGVDECGRFCESSLRFSFKKISRLSLRYALVLLN
jgi:hypothetical protein